MRARPEPSATIGSIVNTMPSSSSVRADASKPCGIDQGAVEVAADLVPDELAHDAEAAAHLLLDRPPDRVHRPARLDGRHAGLQRTPAGVQQALRQPVDLADRDGLAEVAVHAVQVDRHVDADDVAVGERERPGMPWQITSLTAVQIDRGKPR